MLYLLLTTTLLMMTWPRYAGRMVFLSLLSYFLLLLHLWGLFTALPSSPTLLLVGGLLRVDEGILFSLSLLLFLGLVISLRTGDLGWEFHLVLLGGLTGALYMVTSYDLLPMVIGFEFLNLCTYLLLSLYRGTETATLKYLLSSAFYSTFLLLGVSFFYASTGSTGYDALFASLSYGGEASLVPQLLLLVTLSFKLGLVPTHLWVPDVYDGLPMTLLLWMGTVPKATLLLWLPTVYPLFPSWSPYLLVLGVASFSLSALLLGAQYRLKRFLAYSAIGHLGFLVVAYALGDYHAYWFYVTLYMVTTLAQFVLLGELPAAELLRHGTALQGHRPLGLAFLAILFTMASLPPFGGFYGKLLILFAMVDGAHFILALLLIVASLRSAAYYLKWIQTSFFGTPLGGGSLTVAYPHLLAFLVTAILPSTLLLL